MRTLAKKTLRDLWLLGWRAVGIALIMGIGVWFFAGGYMGRDSLFNTRDAYYDELRLADLDIYFDAATASEMPDLDIPGATVARRFFRQTSIDMAGVEPVAMFIIHQHETGRRPVNDIKLVQGEPLRPGDAEGILLEKSFAQARGFKVGDTIALRSLGFPVEVTVRGLVITPEFLVPMGSYYQLVPVKGSLGVAFATMDAIEDVFGYPMYNNACFLYHRGSDPAAVKKRILAAMKDIKITRSTERQEQFSYKFLQEDLKGFDVFVPAVVFLVSIVVFVVTVMVFNRLVQAQRREIGVFMALGYTPQGIFLSFLAMGLFLGLAGGCLGAVCSPLMCRLIGRAYGFHLGLPDIRYVYPLQYALQGIVIGAAITLFSCIPPLLSVFRMTPKDAIRSAAPERRLTRLLAAAGALGGDSLILRYSLRNLLRRPGASFATVALIALSIGICTAFYASSESWDWYAQKALAQEKWDLVATFRVPLSWEEAARSWNRKELSDIRPMIAAAGEIRGEKFRRDFVLNAVPDLSQVMDLDFSQGGYFSSDDANEILFTTIDSVPVEVGDWVTATIDKKKHRFRVAGILKRMTIRMAYIPMKTAERVISDKPVGFFARTRLPSPRIREIIYSSDENVAWIQPKADVRKAVFEFLGHARVITVIALGVSLFLGVLFLLTGITLNIRERESEYATFSSLGFSDRFIAAVVLAETVMEGLLGVGLSVPISYLFSYYLNQEMARAWFELELYLSPRDVVRVIAYALGFLPLAALPGLRHLLTMDVASAVRYRSFG